MSRKERLKKIMELVEGSEVSTQTDIAEALNSLGYNVTQATVSRDVKELCLVKMPGKEKKFRYGVQSNENKLSKLANLFKESVISINTAMNLLVIRTYPGSANAACTLLDELHLPDVVGNIAGDDTILVIAKTAEAVPAIYDNLESYII